MKVNIHPSWINELETEFKKPYFKDLIEFVKEEYDQNTCFPDSDNIFEAFNRATFDRVKVVILGQDPYHGPGQAHGLCFSVLPNAKLPPSLKNIYKELETDLGKPIPATGNLEHWANQGVLMLNAILTVRAHEAGSHTKKGWEEFTDKVIEIISAKKENVVFLLWGGPAKKKGAKIDPSKHLILTSGHPSPLSAIRGYWFGNRHFSITNNYLVENGKEPIDW
ncbi:uracil-DNA glycosylase [Antarcticibacterium flavum]|uniref:Uracil-DNA glycosylase n=1 Tax=Antarcticibacterium flavum TaxID=2058175 RepID=A0A5B7X0C4_9FLAO|nr:MULTISPECIES: uracil-DNA glycosylase [Antarcticibacterium]MCM4158859.1 uracil-DNA glycosylase [Antarcticibacterium sp. W02-3]QCY68118.1 uracil-DNA glycosylase [Antarcticibacterium flavum]